MSKKEGVCRFCNKSFTDITSYRKYVCRECYNSRSKETMRERSMTLRGYLQAQFISVRNHPTRSRFGLDISVDYLIDVYDRQGGRCALSGIEMSFGYDRDNPFTMSIDRIDSNKGYTKDNVQLVLSALNLFKSTFDQKDLYFIAQEFIKTSNENLIL